MADPTSTGARRRAEPHDRGARWSPLAPLAIALLAACAPQEGPPAGRPATHGEHLGDPAALLAELVEAYRPVPLEATSDKHDAALQRRRELMERLVGGDGELGRAALAAFRASEERPEDLRRALLEVAARCDPVGCASQLEHMLLSYDAELGLGLRTHAAELLAATSPARALEVIEPLVLAEREQATYPPRETLVRCWARAARATGVTRPQVLADVATDIAQPPDARYAAIQELGRFGGTLAVKALEELLFETASDAYLRRKAAQALQQVLPPAELCPILERAAAHEHDEVFLAFVADMLAKSCP